MTDVAEVEPVPTVRPVAELFTGAVSALWATTYGLDLALFNEFLLGRLGDPPLNVAILADHRRLSESLARIPAERVDTLAPVNRRWLLRPVRPGGQAFHPKSYLAVTARGATLMVGSGNLSTGGLDDGREVFTTFRSGTPAGDAAITAWRAWMRNLVETLADVALAERFRDLEDRLPPPPAVTLAVPSPLLHNLDASIESQLVATVRAAETGGVDEMILAAPYYDADAIAAGQLLSDLAPRRVRLFVTASTSVNGQPLVDRLAASGARVEVAAYEPDRFVHAKLIGVISGERGWLLSGSANLSQAALTRTVGANGNVELAVLASLDPEEVRSVFIPPGLSVAPRSLESLLSLSFSSDPEPDAPAVRLVSATAVTDGRVEVISEPGVELGWQLDDLETRQPLTVTAEGRGITAAPVAGRLVQLAGADGEPLSNRVVVDDPAALAAVLVAGAARPDADRPVELGAGDLDTPLAQALVWLHRNLVMDVSERLASGPAGGIKQSEGGEQGDDDLWVRLEREKLARDPRANRYGRIWTRTALGGDEPLIELLDALRARTPTQPAITAPQGGSLLRLLLDEPVVDPKAEEASEAPGRRWKISTRIRVRARNVLRRWAAAQTDPRLVWVDPLAPAGNFAMIAAALARLYLELARDPERVELTADDLHDLWLRWLLPFVGTGAGDGWLDQLDSGSAALAAQRLPDWLPESVAALCWLAVRPGGGHRDRVLASQPLIASALSHGLLDTTQTTVDYLGMVTGTQLTLTQVDDQLLDTIAFIDDALWCARTAAELALERLELHALGSSSSVNVRIDVAGIPDPLLDPRVPRLVAAARHYRRCNGVALRAADASWRISVADGEPVGYLTGVGTATVDSTGPLMAGTLERLTATSGVLADLFPAAQVA